MAASCEFFFDQAARAAFPFAFEARCLTGSNGATGDFGADVVVGMGLAASAAGYLPQAQDYRVLISPIGLLEPIQNQDHRIIPGCPWNPYRFIHTKCPLSPGIGDF